MGRNEIISFSLLLCSNVNHNAAGKLMSITDAVANPKFGSL